MAYSPTEQLLSATAKCVWRVDRRRLAAVLLLLAFVLAGVLGQSIDSVPPGMSRLDFTLERMQRSVEPAIYIGGIVVSRSRNTIAAGVMGCATGAMIGGGLSLATGGLALPLAASLGCGIGALSGGALGWPLDDYASF
jgi:hypothetical protein